MKSTTRAGGARFAAAVLLSLLVLGPAFAQDEAGGETTESGEDAGGTGRFTLQLETWITQPSGADLTVGLRQPSDSAFGTEIESLELGTDARLRYRAGYRMPGDAGSLMVTWYATAPEVEVSDLTPTEFQFLETNTAPVFQGAFDDGRADGYQSSALLTVRDLRLSYYREFRSESRVRSRWFAGYRRFSHNRQFETRYYGLVPNFPPVLPPLSASRPDLEPSPDRAATRSEFSARGAEAGLEFDVPMWSDRVWLETGFSVAAMRGKVDSTYESRTHFYAFRGGTPDEIYQDPNDPAFLEDEDLTRGTFQEAVDLSISGAGEETGTALVEGFLGFRWRFWRVFEVMGGYRVTYVDKASEEFKITDIEANRDLSQFNITGFERVSRSLTLEGYYVGLAAVF